MADEVRSWGERFEEAIDEGVAEHRPVQLIRLAAEARANWLAWEADCKGKAEVIRELRLRLRGLVASDEEEETVGSKAIVRR